MSAAADRLRRVVLSVPALSGPPVGGRCCAVSCDDILLEENSWPGLLVLDVDPELGTAVVLVTAGHDQDLSEPSWRFVRTGLKSLIPSRRLASPRRRSAAREGQNLCSTSARVSGWNSTTPSMRFSFSPAGGTSSAPPRLS